MKNNLKNNFADIYFLIIYHFLAVLFTFSTLLLINNSDLTSLTDPQTWLKILTKKKTSKVLITPPVQEAAFPIIEKIIGDVLYIEKGLGERPAKSGERIKTGSIIETKEKSTALLKFSGEYKWQMRLVPNSRLNIDELMEFNKQDQKERSLINLVKGAVYVFLTRKSPAIQMKVKTRYAVFGVRGTKFVVATSDKEYSLLTVQEGEVEVENLKTMKFSSVTAGTTFSVLEDGTEKVATDGNYLNSFNWDLNNDESQFPDVMGIINSLTTSAAPEDNSSRVSSPDPMLVKKMEESFDSAIQVFKDDDQKLNARLTQLTAEYVQDEEKLKQEDLKITSDIDCLENKKGRCNLYTEDILIKRGFPRTFGPPQVIRSLIEDLKKYQLEQKETLANSQALINELDELRKKRIEVMKMVEKKKIQGAASESLIIILNDPEITTEK